MTDFGESLVKAKTLLQQSHTAQAVQSAAGALEALLVELYDQLLDASAPPRQRQLVEA